MSAGVVPSVFIMPGTTADPHRVRMRRITPMPAHPEPTAVPNPFTADPDVIRAWRDHDGFHRRWRLRFWNISHRAAVVSDVAPTVLGVIYFPQ
jgi:hypothetical protein